MVGICLIRLKDIRPRGFGKLFGVSSENAAHRIAVEWDQEGEPHEGVFIPRRDTSSTLQKLVGGRIFPGVHHAARFVVEEANDDYRLHMNSHDDQTVVQLHARLGTQIPAASLFNSLEEASEFFARGAVGYSLSAKPGCCDGLELFTTDWSVKPLEIVSVQSSYFHDPRRFPPGTIEFDCALLMRNIKHEWHTLHPKEFTA